MTDILNKAHFQFRQNLPFVLYNKPNAKECVGIFQENDDLFLVDDYTETGFVFAPFDENEIVLIPEDRSIILVEDFEINVIPEIAFHAVGNKNNEDKAQFEALVQKAVDAIGKGSFDKVVLSRKEATTLRNFDLTVLIQRLFAAYPSAYTYCFFHPKVGLWLGAFSEQLFKIKENALHTMAVAGTQVFQDNTAVAWGNKEKEEQQFVTDYIVKNLEKCASGLTWSEPYTMRAGNVVHIKTDIKGILNAGCGLGPVIEILHPTPAVCGLPKEKAKAFIMENEGYDRQYYSGFFGEMNKDFISGEKASDFYVNLRCMQIELTGTVASVNVNTYMGCGITKDSIPGKEWEETVNKSMTIKKILN